MLLLENIIKVYGDVAVLDSVSLRVPGGKTLALIGPSGCGKSTLIRVIAGLVSPEDGSVTIDGRQLTARNVAEMRRRLGYVIQDGGLFPHLTAVQNVALAARFLRWKPGRIRERVAELAELTHFPPDGLNRYPTQLSGGQRQRLGLMRALMLDPRILLLDEPLGSLDPMIRSGLQQDLRGIFRLLGKTVVLVTHDLHEAAYFADEIVLLREGRVEQKGSATEFLTAPASEFVTRFVQAQRASDFAAAGADAAAVRSEEEP